MLVRHTLTLGVSWHLIETDLKKKKGFSCVHACVSSAVPGITEHNKGAYLFWRLFRYHLHKTWKPLTTGVSSSQKTVKSVCVYLGCILTDSERLRDESHVGGCRAVCQCSGESRKKGACVRVRESGWVILICQPVWLSSPEDNRGGGKWADWIQQSVSFTFSLTLSASDA